MRARVVSHDQLFYKMRLKQTFIANAMKFQNVKTVICWRFLWYFPE